MNQLPGMYHWTEIKALSSQFPLLCLSDFRFCGLRDPSWAELTHFVHFLNIQLLDFESSNFCGDTLEDVLPGFPTFVVKFMIQMSRVRILGKNNIPNLIFVNMSEC